jgi:hypothetical protein
LNREDAKIWLRHWRGIESAVLDRTRVAAPEVVEPDSQNERYYGFFDVVDSASVACFVSKTALFVQYASQRWNVSENRVRVRHRRPSFLSKMATFTLRVNGITQLYVAYDYLDDPSLSPLEMESTDWWLWLASILSTKASRDGIVDHWRHGFCVTPVERSRNSSDH